MIAVALAACVSDRVSTAVLAAPPLRDPDRVRWVAIGDTGKGTAEQARVAEGVRRVCARAGCDLLLLLGDNVYPAGLESEEDPRGDALIADPYRGIAPQYLVLGNHDWGGTSPVRADAQIAWAAQRPNIHLPAHAWTMRAGPVSFLVFDTTAVFLRGEDFAREWALDALARDDAPYRVVAGHHPFRSDGPHGNAGAYEGWRHVPWLSGAALARLFDDTLCGRVDLYLAGHDHSLQLHQACGVDLVVSGSGGSVTELHDRGNATRFSAATLGFAWLDLGADGGVVRFHDADGGLLHDARLRPHPR